MTPGAPATQNTNATHPMVSALKEVHKRFGRLEVLKGIRPLRRPR